VQSGKYGADHETRPRLPHFVWSSDAYRLGRGRRCKSKATCSRAIAKPTANHPDRLLHQQASKHYRAGCLLAEIGGLEMMLERPAGFVLEAIALVAGTLLLATIFVLLALFPT
jgi:hypothetical protein